MLLKLKTHDNYELYCQFDQVENPKGTIILSHGFVEYGAHYGTFAQKVMAQGYNCFRYDERGHGRTSAPLGDVTNYQDYVSDLDICVDWVQAQQPDGDVFTLGFSLGGMITMVYGIMVPQKVTGQIVIGGLVMPQMQFDAISAPALTIHEFLELMGTAGDKGIQQLVAMDSPYVLKKATNAFLKESLVKAPEFIQDHLVLYRYPILIMHGALDPIIPVRNSRLLYEQLPVDDKTLKIYDNQYHDLLRVKEADHIVSDIIAWCNDHR